MMMHRYLSAVVKTVRLRYAVPFILLLVAVYWMGIRPWMTNWGSTAAERQMALPGDEFLSNSTGYATKAITINASPDVVWQWLAQVGQDRAGFYSYTWLENLFGADIHNTDTLHPEWQKLVVGEGAWRMVPADYLGGVGKDAVKRVLISEPGHTLVLEMWGAHVILPMDPAASKDAAASIDAAASGDAVASRLIVRGSAVPADPMSTLFIDPMVFTMERRMLLGLKARAEGRPDAPAALMVIAWLGWSAAGISVAGLFLSQRRRRYWLVLPIVATLPALLMSRDAQAGLAAFIAIGITVLGFLIFGRSWWGSFLSLGSIVMLTLLLAPEAFTAIGLTFVLLLLIVSGAIVAGRSRTENGAARGLAVS